MNDNTIKKFISNPLFKKDILLSKDYSYPKISIITPSLNQGVFLEKCILSVLNQNYPNLEYIIIDGGSTDNSVQIIKKYEKYIDYWISEKDKGQSDALNKGYKRATGEIIGWQNSDDLYLPETFQKVLRAFQKYPFADVIYGNRLDINEKDNIIGRLKYTKFSKIVYQYDGISISIQSAFWKKNLFEKIGFFDLNCRFAMDYEFFLRAAKKNIHFQYINDYFGAARRYAKNRTNMFIDSPVFKKEIESIDQKYDKKKEIAIILKIYALAYRFFHYILQGDFKYVFEGFIRRLKNNSLIKGQ